MKRLHRIGKYCSAALVCGLAALVQGAILDFSFSFSFFSYFGYCAAFLIGLVVGGPIGLGAYAAFEASNESIEVLVSLFLTALGVTFLGGLGASVFFHDLGVLFLLFLPGVDYLALVCFLLIAAYLRNN